ncbi:hypothetical protein QOM21_17375 [Streptomyces sp. Pv4-95]|uniref:hypothetical protein n=1 Tax=Streptomyces sp. Pv4-95 TaxID=3049543 RepID=UPI0038912AEC
MSERSPGQGPEPDREGRGRGWGPRRPVPPRQRGWGPPADGPPPYGAPPGGSGQPRKRAWPWVVLGLCLLLVGGCAAAVAVMVSDVTDEITKTVQVSYKVTGDAKDVAVTYSTWRGDDMSTSQETARTLPWVKEMQGEGLVKGGALTLTLGAGGGTATCSVSVDGAQAKTATATGPNATASCGY